MTVDELVLLLPTEKKEHIQKMLEDLKKKYDEQESAITIITDGQTWKFTLKDEYLKLGEQLMSSTELPKPILETLA
jgi:chromosome segregation and condensation protein ScpB